MESWMEGADRRRQAEDVNDGKNGGCEGNDNNNMMRKGNQTLTD